MTIPNLANDIRLHITGEFQLFIVVGVVLLAVLRPGRHFGSNFRLAKTFVPLIYVAVFLVLVDIEFGPTAFVVIALLIFIFMTRRILWYPAFRVANRRLQLTPKTAGTRRSGPFLRSDVLVRDLKVEKPPNNQFIKIARRFGFAIPAIEGHIFVNGATGSGKTVFFLLPALCRWRGPAVLTTTKSDVLATLATRPWGRVRILDLRSHHEREACPLNDVIHYSPLPVALSWNAALDLATTMASATPDSGKDAAIWRQMSTSLVACMLHITALKAASQASQGLPEEQRFSIRDAIATLTPGAIQGLYIDAINFQASWECIDRMKQFGETVRETLSGYCGSAQSLLTGWSGPVLDDACQPTDFDPNEFLNSEDVVVIIQPTTDSGAGGRSAVVIAILTLLYKAVEVATASGKPLRPQLFLALDEVANIAPIQPLPNWLAESRGRGIVIAIATQSMSQLHKRWGVHGAASIFTNCQTKLFLSPPDDDETVKWLSQRSGTKEVQRGPKVRPTYFDPAAPVLTPSKIRRTKKVIVVVGKKNVRLASRVRPILKKDGSERISIMKMRSSISKRKIVKGEAK